MQLDADPGARLSPPSPFRTWRLLTKLLVALIPSVVVILAATGYVTGWFSTRFLNESIERSVRLQTMSLAHELEVFFERTRADLFLLARSPVDGAAFLGFMEARREAGVLYREAAFTPLSGEGGAVVAAVEGREPSVLSPEAAARARAAFGTGGEPPVRLDPGEIALSGVTEVSYPGAGGPARVLRMTARRVAPPEGHVSLSVDLVHLRDILSLFTSSRSPLHAFARSPEQRYAYFFDRDGWILFQSEDVEGKPLATETARRGLSGTFGKPGLALAFRPAETERAWWSMAKDVLEGNHGAARVPGAAPDSMTEGFFLGYAPVGIVTGSGGKTAVAGGVAYVDRSRLTLWAGYRQVDVMFVLTLVTIVLISLVIWGLSRAITRPILRLTAEVDRIEATGALAPVAMPDHDRETSFLRAAINRMIATLGRQMEEIRVRDERIETERLREKVRLEEEISALRRRIESQDIPEIKGAGPVLESLRGEILKTAPVDADVLIVGETGTGKQLAAEAIHKNSARAGKPFISINCGALDENLLLDTLFGHVRGAFTEARQPRQGAFLAADGGTLFLDEIGTASQRVQQALLRAIALRRIKPLGSDQDVAVDVRLIAATNVDLKDLMERRGFREDLYYRLAVLSIRTPPLRDHPESIPVLVDHFLRRAAQVMGKPPKDLSRGALEKLARHRWPGNVRELENCITRAVAMTDGPVIQAGDVLGDTPAGAAPPPPKPAPAKAPPPPPDTAPALPPGLNPRQRKAFPEILRAGEVTRQEYQRLLGDSLPPRTALYDLQDLVNRGLLTRSGKGPATRYHLAGLPDSAQSPLRD